jgi:hypothetical protein
MALAVFELFKAIQETGRGDASAGTETHSRKAVLAVTGGADLTRRGTSHYPYAGERPIHFVGQGIKIKVTRRTQPEPWFAASPQHGTHAPYPMRHEHANVQRE